MPGPLTRRDCAATFILNLHSEISWLDSAAADSLQVDLISACYAGFLKGDYDGAMAATDTGEFDHPRGGAGDVAGVFGAGNENGGGGASRRIVDLVDRRNLAASNFTNPMLLTVVV